MAPVRKSSGLKCDFTKKPKQYWDRHHQIRTRQQHDSAATRRSLKLPISLCSFTRRQRSPGGSGVLPSSPCLSGRQLQSSCREKRRVSQSCDLSGCLTMSTPLLPPMWEHHGIMCRLFSQLHSDKVVHNTRTHTEVRRKALYNRCHDHPG